MIKNVIFISISIIIVSCNNYYDRLETNIYKNMHNNFVEITDTTMSLFSPSSLQPIVLSKIEKSNLYSTFSYNFGCHFTDPSHKTHVEKVSDNDNILLVVDNKCALHRNLFSSPYKILDEILKFDSIIVLQKYNFPKKYSLTYTDLMNSNNHNDQKLNIELFILTDRNFQLFNKKSNGGSEAVIKIFIKGEDVIIKPTTDFPGMFGSFARCINYKYPSDE